MTYVDLKPPAEPATRNVVCTRCGALIGLWEAPEGHTDAAALVCTVCEPPITFTELLEELRAR